MWGIAWTVLQCRPIYTGLLPFIRLAILNTYTGMYTAFFIYRIDVETYVRNLAILLL